jgi:hypothetical protein
LRLVKRLFERVLEAYGYRLEPVGPWLIEGAADPFDVLQRAVRMRPFVMHIPFSRLRGLHWFPLDQRHPFVAALQAHRAGSAHGYEDSPLRLFYAQASPATAAEALGLTAAEAPGFAGLCPRAMILPWNEGTPERTAILDAETEMREARQCGAVLAPADGTKFFGPVSEAKATLHLRRLLTVQATLEKEGWRRHDKHDGDAAGRLMLNNGCQWCVQIWTGQHRVAAAAALELRSIPVRIPWRPIWRSEVDRWPQVVAKRVTRKGALAVFDRVMDGRPPWEDAVQKVAELPGSGSY